MKIGICLDIMQPIKGYCRWGDDVYKLLKSHGYDCVDYSFSYETHPVYTLPPKERKEYLQKLKKTAEDAGITFSQTHGTWGWPPVEGEEQVKDWLEKMKIAVISTAELGCKYCVVHPLMTYGWQNLKNAEPKIEETWKSNFDFFTTLSKTAEEYDVTICVENMPMTDFSLATPEQVLDLVKAINNEHVKICLDTGHVAAFNNLVVEDEVRRLGDYIKVFHIHDTNFGRDAHMFPYFGKINWKNFAKSLKDINFDGVFSLETYPPVNMNDELYIDYSKALYKTAKQIVDMI